MHAKRQNFVTSASLTSKHMGFTEVKMNIRSKNDSGPHWMLKVNETMHVTRKTMVPDRSGSSWVQIRSKTVILQMIVLGSTIMTFEQGPSCCQIIKQNTCWPAPLKATASKKETKQQQPAWPKKQWTSKKGSVCFWLVLKQMHRDFNHGYVWCIVGIKTRCVVPNSTGSCTGQAVPGLLQKNSHFDGTSNGIHLCCCKFDGRSMRDLSNKSNMTHHSCSTLETDAKKCKLLNKLPDPPWKGNHQAQLLLWPLSMTEEWGAWMNGWMEKWLSLCFIISAVAKESAKEWDHWQKRKEMPHLQTGMTGKNRTMVTAKNWCSVVATAMMSEDLKALFPLLVFSCMTSFNFSSLFSFCFHMFFKVLFICFEILKHWCVCFLSFSSVAFWSVFHSSICISSWFKIKLSPLVGLHWLMWFQTCHLLAATVTVWMTFKSF